MWILDHMRPKYVLLASVSLAFSGMASPTTAQPKKDPEIEKALGVYRVERSGNAQHVTSYFSVFRSGKTENIVYYGLMFFLSKKDGDAEKGDAFVCEDANFDATKKSIWCQKKVKLNKTEYFEVFRVGLAKAYQGTNDFCLALKGSDSDLSDKIVTNSCKEAADSTGKVPQVCTCYQLKVCQENTNGPDCPEKAKSNTRIMYPPSPGAGSGGQR